MRSSVVSFVIVALVISPTLASAQGLTLRTGDGLVLELSAAGEVTAAQIGAAKLPLAGAGGFYIADFHNQPEPENMVANPGFEQGAEGWNLRAGQSIDEKIFHSGKRAVRLEVPGPESASSNVGCTVPVKPNTAYRCELWVRRENVGVCGAYASERDDNNKLTGKQTQVGRSIPKLDGVWHKLIWELTTQPETTRLNFRSDIYKSTGTLWLDDFFIAQVGKTVYQPVTGQVEKRGDAVAFRGALADAGLELQATLTADDEAIRVEGVVRDTSGRDRAVGVRFGLPINAQGWTWYNELEEREEISAEKAYRHTYACKSGIGVCSVYPWSALSGPDAGLTLALPVSQGPRVFVIQHDQRQPQTSLTFYFGLAQDAANNPSRAPFSFLIYTHAPAWGMRSAMEKYYRLFPESFVKRPRYEGYLNYANLERYDPDTHSLVAYRTNLDDASDFGEGYNFIWHLHGCYDFRMVPYDDPKRPSDEKVMELLGEMVEREKEQPRYYIPTAETIKKLTYGPDGQILYIGDTRYWRPQEGYNHTDKPGWGLNFRVNEDPGVSEHLANVSRQKLEQYAEDETRKPFDAMLTADAIEGYFANSSGLNFRREHFATTQVPLTFGRESLKVAMPNTIWDFHKQVWWPLTQQYQVVTHGNANKYEQTFTMPFVDLPMIENEWDRGHPERFERYLRAIAHHKIWRFWRVLGAGEKDEASVRRHFARGLAYAVYPCVGPLQSTGGGLEKYRDLYRQYVPAIEELSIAGWEPVPYARATEGVIVERYGSYEAGELHFTLRNYDDEAAKVTEFSLDRQALGIPEYAHLVAVDILPGLAVTRWVEPKRWKVEVEPDNARAFWMGTREQMAQHGFRLAERLLGKIDRLFATELTEQNRADMATMIQLAQTARGFSGDKALLANNRLYGHIDELQQAIETKAPVDLAKLCDRLRVALSHVVAGVVEVEVSGERVIENGLRGETLEASWSLDLKQVVAIHIEDARVRCPWEDIEAQCTATPGVKDTPDRWGLDIIAQLYVPAEPPRPLMPYLVEVTGEYGHIPFVISVPVDVKVSEPLTVTALPQRVFRGEESKLNIIVTNRLQQPGEIVLKFSPPGEVEMEPSELDLALGAEAQIERLVTVRLAENARLGEFYIPYEITSDNARLNMQGKILLSVSDPVPRVKASRVNTRPKLDGKLDEQVWQGEPTIAELTLLQGAKPATEKTPVWVAYDDAGLYVALRCAESQMHKLVANLSDRGDPLYQDDDVEIFLLPPGAPRAFQFAVNSLGTIGDNFGNKAEWLARAQRYEDAWTVEVFVPYEAVGVSKPPERGSSWACQFGRQQKAKGETTSWTPGAGFNRPNEFGELVFD